MRVYKALVRGTPPREALGFGLGQKTQLGVEGMFLKNPEEALGFGLVGEALKRGHG